MLSLLHTKISISSPSSVEGNLEKSFKLKTQLVSPSEALRILYLRFEAKGAYGDSPKLIIIIIRGLSLSKLLQ